MAGNRRRLTAFGGPSTTSRGRFFELGTPDPVVLYGGAVDENDIDQLLSLENLDGVGATRAALDAESFLNIIDRVASRHGSSRHA